MNFCMCEVIIAVLAMLMCDLRIHKVKKYEHGHSCFADPENYTIFLIWAD